MRLLPLALLTAAVALPASATPIVLDDYSSDANFVAGKYQLIDVYAGYSVEDRGSYPTQDIIVEDGQLTIATGATGAHMWVGPERLSQVGDMVTMDITMTLDSTLGAAGMFFDTDITDSYYGAEIRYQNSDLFWSSKLVPGAVESVATDLVFLEPEADYLGVQTHFEASVIAIGIETITIQARLTSPVFEPAIVTVTLDGTEAYFGPSAWIGGALETTDPVRPQRRYIYHDNLTFTPVPEPASLAILSLGGLLLTRRRRSA